MKILLIKMSSMGDIFHTFPAITDLKAFDSTIEIDWVVEDGFKEIVAWHPAVNKVIPIHLRRWMKERSRCAWREVKVWRRALRVQEYDLVIDAQGLLKSALVAKMANARVISGFDLNSARESIACLFYQNTFYVSKNQHAVERSRQLFAKVFGYSVPTKIDFGIHQNFMHVQKQPQQLIFIIGTSWLTKLWSTQHWQALTALAFEKGYQVEIIWGSPEEQAVADSIIAACPGATRPRQRLSITTIAEKLVAAAAVVGLDTGFSHLAGALETITLALYGATSPVKVGLIGEHTLNIQLETLLHCMPCHKRQCKWLNDGSTETPLCMNGIQPERVWRALTEKLIQVQ
jgi:heptosyltransferase I